MIDAHRAISSSSVFVVSGGARGITAACVIKLAQRYSCRFILLGRSALVDTEPEWATACFDETDLKRRIARELELRGEKPVPKRLQDVFNAIRAGREIAATLRAVERAGGHAEYLAVDVADAHALRAQLTPAIRRLGRVTGVIHGAGHLADKRIERKTVQDFASVYTPKVRGLQNLLGVLPPSQLDYLILFSSAAAFYGNPGQSDYAIANEILNKAAYLIKRANPTCRVVAIDWGPWDGGMVSPTVKQALARRSVDLIPIERGAEAFVEILSVADHTDVQLVVGARPSQTGGDRDPELRGTRFRRKLTLAANPFLHDHVIGGRPVLPAACATAWIAEGSEQLHPTHRTIACEDLKILKGIAFDESLADEHVLDLSEVPTHADDRIQLEALIWSKNSQGKLRYHYRGRITLLRQIPERPVYETVDLTEDPALEGAQPYRDGILFHGPCFQGIVRILNMSPNSLTMECVAPAVAEDVRGQFVSARAFDPFVADIAGQSVLVWARYFLELDALPTAVQKGEQFEPLLPRSRFYVAVAVRSRTAARLVADVVLHDRLGRIYMRYSGFEVMVGPYFAQVTPLGPVREAVWNR